MWFPAFKGSNRPQIFAEANDSSSSIALAWVPDRLMQSAEENGVRCKTVLLEKMVEMCAEVEKILKMTRKALQGYRTGKLTFS